MSIYNLFNDPYDRFPFHLSSPAMPSVYVISDSQLAAYKRKQTEAEITELEKLIDSHKSSIERLETTVTDLKNTLKEEKQAALPADQRVLCLMNFEINA